jgi:hypothetical protein
MLDDRVNPEHMINSIEDSWRKPPSLTQSAFHGFLNELTESAKLSFSAESQITGIKRQNPVEQGLQVINASYDRPSTGLSQEIANGLGSIAGFMADPANAILGFGAGKAVEKGVEFGAKFMPEAISSFTGKTAADLLGEDLAKKTSKFVPKTIGSLGKSLTKTFAEASAVSVPMAFNENFNENTGKFDIIGGATQSLRYGALGLGLHTMGLTAGVVYGKIKLSRVFKAAKIGDASKANIADVDKAFENGKINEDEHEWAHTYLKTPDDMPKLNELAVKILKSEKYNVDSSTNEAFMQIASKEAVDNIHSSIFDQLASNASGDLKSAMTDYNHANVIDAIKSESSHMVNGLKGFVSYMEDRLERKVENLKNLTKSIKKSSLKHINSEHPMSQKSLIKRQKKEGAIPNTITKSMRDEKPVAASKEMNHLEEHFNEKDKLPDNFQLSEEYNRLKDLSHFSERARALLHHVDLRNEYDVQEAYKGMVDTLSKLMDGDIEKYAQPDRLHGYLKNRLGNDITGLRDGRQNYTPERAYRDRREVNDIDDLKNESKDNVDHDEEFLNDNDVDVRESGAEDLEKDNRDSAKMYKQYKATVEARKKLVSCALGSK